MKLLREPLLHFLALGAVLFIAFWAMGRWVIKDQITVTPDIINMRIKAFRADFKRDPTPQEVDKIIEDYIREEVLCRKGWEEGLDKDDSTIRARLKQLVEFQFVSGAAADIPDPTDADLEAFLKERADIFRQPDGTLPTLEEIRPTVQSVWLATRQKQAGDEAYQKLRDQYHVVVNRPQPTSAPATMTAEAN